MSKSPVAARRPHQYTNGSHPQQQPYEYSHPHQGIGQQQQQRSPPVNGHSYDDWQHRQGYSHASQKPQQHQQPYPNLAPGDPRGPEWGHPHGPPHHHQPPPQHLQQQYRYPEESAWAMPPPLSNQSHQQQHHHSSSSASKGSHSASKQKPRSNGVEGTNHPSSASPPRQQGHRKTQSRDFLPPPLPPTGHLTSPGSVSPSARSYGHANGMMPPPGQELDPRPRAMSSRPLTPPGMRSSGDFAGAHKRKRSEGHDRYPSMEQPPWGRPSHEDMAAASGVSRPHEVRHHSETPSRPHRELEPLAFERESMGPPAQKKSSSSRKQQHKQESQSYDSAMPHGLAPRAASHPVQHPPPPHSYHPYESGMMPPARGMEEVLMGYALPQDGYYPPYGEEGRVRLDGRLLEDARPTAVKHSSKAGRDKSKGSKDMLVREEQKRLDDRQQPRLVQDEKVLKPQQQQVSVHPDYPPHPQAHAPPPPTHQRPAAVVEMPAAPAEGSRADLRPLHPPEPSAGPAQLQHPDAASLVPSIQRHRVISDSVWQWLDEFQGVLPESPSSAAVIATPPSAQIPTATYAGTFLYDAYKQPLLPGELLTRNVASLIEVRIQGSLLGPYRESSDARARRGWTLGWRARHSGIAVDVPAGCKIAQKDDINRKSVKANTSPAFWSQPSLSQRKLWGSEVYTDDSDVLAMCLHSGWIEGPSKLSQVDAIEKGVEDTFYWPPPDVKVTLRVAPRLMSYRESFGGGLWSRNWLGTHQGVSLVVERVELQPSGSAEVYKLPGWRGSKINMQRMVKEKKRVAALEKKSQQEPDAVEDFIVAGVRSLSVFPLSEARTKIKTTEEESSGTAEGGPITGKDRIEGDSFWWRSGAKHLLPLTSALR